MNKLFSISVLALMVVFLSMPNDASGDTKAKNRGMRPNYGKNMSFYDDIFSQGKTIWDTAPQLAALDPSAAFSQLWEMFDIVYKATDDPAVDQSLDFWIFTLTQTFVASAHSITLPDSLGGVANITTSDTDNDSVELQWNTETVALNQNQPMWFEIRMQISSITQSDYIVGLCITDTAIIDAVSDGIYFMTNDADANIDVVTEKNGSATTTDTGTDFVANTWIRLGMYFDGGSSDRVYFFIDGVQVGFHTANIPDDEALTVSVAIQNGEGAAMTTMIDYIKVVQVK